MTAELILKMIEDVSPDDTAKLDEIDARVGFYLGDHKNLEEYYKGKDQNAKIEHAIFWGHITKYTRSRDALKAIRPEGCWVERIIQHKTSKNWDCTIAIIGEVFSVSDKAITLPTEELAELHAIIQAIEYERSNETNS